MGWDLARLVSAQLGSAPLISIRENSSTQSRLKNIWFKSGLARNWLEEFWLAAQLALKWVGSWAKHEILHIPAYSMKSKLFLVFKFNSQFILFSTIKNGFNLIFALLQRPKVAFRQRCKSYIQVDICIWNSLSPKLYLCLGLVRFGLKIVDLH